MAHGHQRAPQLPRYLPHPYGSLAWFYEWASIPGSPTPQASALGPHAFPRASAVRSAASRTLISPASMTP